MPKLPNAQINKCSKYSACQIPKTQNAPSANRKMPKLKNAQSAKCPNCKIPKVQHAQSTKYRTKICLDMPGYALIIEKAQVPKVPKWHFETTKWPTGQMS